MTEISFTRINEYPPRIIAASLVPSLPSISALLCFCVFGCGSVVVAGAHAKSNTIEANTKPAMHINVLLPRLVDRYKDMVCNIEKTTQPEVNRLRHRLSLVMGEQIVLHPETNDGEKHLAFEVAGDFDGLMKAVDYKGKIGLVAGSRFRTYFVRVSLDPTLNNFVFNTNRLPD